MEQDRVRGAPLVPPFLRLVPPRNCEQIVTLFHLFHFFEVLFHPLTPSKPLKTLGFLYLLEQVEQLEQGFYKIVHIGSYRVYIGHYRGIYVFAFFLFHLFHLFHPAENDGIVWHTITWYNDSVEIRAERLRVSFLYRRYRRRWRRWAGGTLYDSPAQGGAL